MKNFFGENEVVLFHGTATEPQEILKKGFDNIPGIWDCSEFNEVYFYELHRWVKAEGFDEEDDYIDEMIITQANQQGQLQNAFKENPSCVTYVLEFHFPEEFEEFVEDDNSCENMHYYGAVQVNMARVNEYMQKGKCRVIVHKFPFAVKCSLLYITGIANNQYITSALDALTWIERSVLENLAKWEFNEVFYEACVNSPDEIYSYEIGYPLCTELNYKFK